MGDFAHGLRLAFRGLALMWAPGVKRFVAAPLAINVTLFGIALYYLFTGLDAFMAWLLPGWLAWLEWLLWPLFAVTALIVVFYTFTAVANFIGAPFNGYLAAAVERHLGTRPPDPGAATVREHLSEAVGALIDELRKLGYFLLWALPLLVLFVIPGINLLAPAVWLAFSAWMLALEYADPVLGNHGLDFKAQRQRLATRRSVNMGFGLGITIMTLVPGLNFLAMPAGVAGATALWTELDRRGDRAGVSR